MLGKSNIIFKGTVNDKDKKKDQKLDNFPVSNLKVFIWF